MHRDGIAAIKVSKGSRGAFAQHLAQTVTRVQELKGPERLRRLELLCYVEGLVYHSRPTNEHQALRQRIDTALANDETRLEVEMVRMTLADVHRDEERIAERKRTLLDQLRVRFGSLPPEIEQTIQAAKDADKLAEWLRRFATATDLDGIGIQPR